MNASVVGIILELTGTFVILFAGVMHAVRYANKDTNTADLLLTILIALFVAIGFYMSMADMFRMFLPTG